MRLAGCPLDGQSGHDAGRRLLARLYREETGDALPEIRIAPWGKPYFPHSPYFFSVTHTRRRVFAALSCRAVGIDAEELDRTVRPALAEKILSPSELAQYRTAPDPNRALLTFWVLKEAAAKCTGEGLRGYPNQTAFRLDDPRVQIRDGCLLAVISEGDR